MRTRPQTAAAVTAVLALLLAGCTSGAEPDGPTGTATQDADSTDEATTDGVGTTAPPAARGYLCRYVSLSAQEAVAEGELDNPYQLMVEDDEDNWVCETQDDGEPLVRVSILRGEDVWAQQRALAEAEEGVQDGPEWFGQSFASARRVTGLTMCSRPDGKGAEDYEPYALVVEAMPDSEENVTEQLHSVASALSRGVDQALRCSPRMARGELEGPTPDSTP